MTSVALDKVHSSLDFQIKHMMVSKAKGTFQNFDVDFDGSIEDLENASVKVVIPVESIDTGQKDRDDHLKNGDFFEAENHPNLEFVSKKIEKISDDEYKFTGDFTMKGVTNEETFTVEYNGTSKSPMDGSTVAGFDVEGKINREAYGVSFNAPLDTGGVMLGRDVKFTGNFEFIVE
ncbi:YceI family protein [Salimicrobium salexigens]|uniref:Polyisoprenoid-binding protein YceI n=1 Tax=Salimicrobium salexigens TaxID=908941 RepID=A0ABY1KY54_9BACI|nr:YceI family protein [Salimicrobium salexigens]SIS92131.1 Polyisoprenoid-binding protein YceI [Salimicrobium salexigens]